MSEHDVIEALNEIDRRKELMPKHCPSWCMSDHEQAIDEGCDVKSAAGHLSADVGHYLPDLRNAIADRLDRPGNGGWRLQVVAGWPGPSDMPLVEVELHEWTDIERKEVAYRSMFLTSGEARTLAAQLVAMADKLDLTGDEAEVEQIMREVAPGARFGPPGAPSMSIQDYREGR